MASLDQNVMNHLRGLQAYFPREEVLHTISYWYEDNYRNSIFRELQKYILPGDGSLGSKLESQVRLLRQIRNAAGDIAEESEITQHYDRFLVPQTTGGVGHA